MRGCHPRRIHFQILKSPRDTHYTKIWWLFPLRNVTRSWKKWVITLLSGQAERGSAQFKGQAFHNVWSSRWGRDSQKINETLVAQVRHWLEQFPNTLPLFNAAVQYQEHGVFDRNLLHDLSLALEKIWQAILNNGKLLENQLSLIGPFLKTKCGYPASPPFTRRDTSSSTI